MSGWHASCIVTGHIQGNLPRAYVTRKQLQDTSVAVA
ncbi:hypothetical protein WJX77_002316 [Trebouxia sp. C0004]